MPVFKAKDVVAIILIVGILVLNFRGIELMVPQALLLILGYYFARRKSGDDKGI